MIEKIDKGLNLKKLKYKELSVLSSEIREFLIEKVEKRGGHLARNGRQDPLGCPAQHGRHGACLSRTGG